MGLAPASSVTGAKANVDAIFDDVLKPPSQRSTSVPDALAYGRGSYYGGYGYNEPAETTLLGDQNPDGNYKWQATTVGYDEKGKPIIEYEWKIDEEKQEAQNRLLNNLTQDASKILDAVNTGDIDVILSNWNKFCKSVAQLPEYQAIPESDKETRLNFCLGKFMEATAVDDGNGGKTGGIDLRQYIRDKAPGAFSSSFFKVLSLSTVRKDSAAEIEAAITGDRKNIPSDENAKHNIGAITGGVAATAAAGLGAWGGAKVGALCGSWGGPIGMFVGAGAGLLIGGLIGLCCG